LYVIASMTRSTRMFGEHGEATRRAATDPRPAKI
jgi:hypothetical protein